jgi:hypothetical protein
MTNDDEKPEFAGRDELRNLLAEGDTPKLVAGTATMLLVEVLPALDEIRRRLSGLHYQLEFSHIALIQIETIYEHLQDLVPANRRAKLADERMHYRARLERILETLTKQSQSGSNAGR